MDQQWIEKSMTTSMMSMSVVTGIPLAFGLWIIALAANAATIWSGPQTTFSKASGTDPNQRANQDRITPTVWITRGNSGPIYNAAHEAGSYSNDSPAGTEWAYGTTANLANLTFRSWGDWNGWQPPSMVGRDAVVHLIDDDIYVDMKFTYWGSGGGVGYPTGDFAYQRATASPVVEFYNTILDHYFITADANEAATIDGGSAGPGWSRTGDTFKAGGDTFVCRFYGSLSPGPNSNFYTADAGECAFLKRLQANTPATEKRWNFESNDFSTTPAINHACPAGLVPVYRAYNNGFALNIDSNHRITGKHSAIQAVVTRGWIDEGVAMCAPQ